MNFDSIIKSTLNLKLLLQKGWNSDQNNFGNNYLYKIKAKVIIKVLKYPWNNLSGSQVCSK